MEDFNLHASAEATTAAEKILAVDVHHHTRPHGWPRILVILPGIVHFFNGEEIEVHHDGQRNHHVGELESDQQKRTLRASLVPSYFSPLIAAARIDREVQIAGRCRSCWEVRRHLVPHEVDQDHVEVYSLIAMFVLFIRLAIIDVR